MQSLISFLSSETGLAACFSAIATTLTTIGAPLLRGKVNLIWFSPNSTRFALSNPSSPQQPIQIDAGQIVIQNRGRKSAEEVQVVSAPGITPAGYVIIPSVVHKTSAGPNGEWIVEIPFVAPSEAITIQILNGPLINSVRSKGGFGKYVPVVHQRLYPRWMQLVSVSLTVIGILSLFYLLGVIIF